MKRVATSAAIFGGSAAVVVALILYHLEFEEIGLYVRVFLLPLLFTALPYLCSLPLLEKARWRFDQKGVRIKSSGRKSKLPWRELKAYSISTTDELLDHARIRLFYGNDQSSSFYLHREDAQVEGFHALMLQQSVPQKQ